MNINIIDILIVLLIIGALLRGLELGLVRQLFSTGGFFGGLVLGTIIEPHTINLVHTPNARLVVGLTSTLGLALVLLLIGEITGGILKQRLMSEHQLNHADNWFGALLAGASMLAIIWLSASVLTSLPYPGLQSNVQRSTIITMLNRKLPPAPNIIADLSRLITPNGFPDVFKGIEPQPVQTELPTPAELAAAVAKDRESVVKIEGQGCGGIVTGSGFVVGRGFVVTNAHVVAGITVPYVIDRNGTHTATPVAFDPDLDLAVLHTNNLAGTPLTFDANQVPHGTPGGVLGYPGGGPFTANVAAVVDEFTAIGRNIYNQGSVERDVYSIQAQVVPGNSGGPLVDTSGNVMGVVFATSTRYPDTGYALSAPQVISEVNQAEASDHAVGTGSCAE